MLVIGLDVEHQAQQRSPRRSHEPHAAAEVQHTQAPLHNATHAPSSDNLFAETWLQTLALLPVAFQTSLPTREVGLAAVRCLLLRMGVDGDLFLQKDGRLRSACCIPLTSSLTFSPPPPPACCVTLTSAPAAACPAGISSRLPPSQAAAPFPLSPPRKPHAFSAVLRNMSGEPTCAHSLNPLRIPP
jgi:hypothetical protein